MLVIREAQMRAFEQGTMARLRGVVQQHLLTHFRGREDVVDEVLRLSQHHRLTSTAKVLKLASVLAVFGTDLPDWARACLDDRDVPDPDERAERLFQAAQRKLALDARRRELGAQP